MLPISLTPRYGATVLIMLLLGACGGGGGGGSAPPANQPPSANAGADQTVDPGTSVTLGGSGSDADGSVASYAWSQIAGSTVVLNTADQPTATFTATNPAASENLQFRLTVTDDDGATDFDDVVVTIDVNQTPTANAGANQSVVQGASVTLAGLGTDADGTVTSYQWTQVAGPAVTLTGASQATATFTAPTVAMATLLSFDLVVSDDDGDSSTADRVDVTVVEQIPANVTISGSVQYEFVNRGATINSGLNFNDIDLRPIRGAPVQAIDANNQVLANTVSDAAGNYVLSVPPTTGVFIRVRGELQRVGVPAWNVEVRDNTANTNLVLSQRPLYALDGALADSGLIDSTRNLIARTGWGGSSYTGARAAAPFSILDTIYTAVQLVIAADPNAVLAPLDLFWSANNCPVDGNIDNGDITTSFYRSSISSIFLLGCADNDTEEFDVSIIAHEWGHYFEDKVSRSDTLGGRHSGNQQLDARLAFAEGWSNMVAGIVAGDSVYFDSFGGGQGFSFGFDVETITPGIPGWFDEFSIQAILWDLFDADADGVDTVTLGFAPLYDVFVGEQANSAAFTTVFPFVTALKIANPAVAAGIDAIVQSQGINGSQIDPYGSFETNDAGNPDALPLYTEVNVGSNVTLCSTRAFDPDGDRNKLGIYRYLRFSLPAQTTLTFAITKAATPAVTEQSDPDIVIYRDGVLLNAGSNGRSGIADSETAVFTLAAGDYVAEIYEFRFAASTNTPIAADRVCFDVAVN
ncbi:MAG: hypothetical protein AAGH76_05965 [Pseudomonadota bacterium]